MPLLGLLLAHSLASGAATGENARTAVPPPSEPDRLELCLRVDELCREETALSEKGHFGQAAELVRQAEELMRQALGEPVDSPKAWRGLEEPEWTPYHNFLLDRASHQERLGDLQGADATYRLAVTFLDDLPPSAGGLKTLKRRTRNNWAVALDLAGRGRESDRQTAALTPTLDNTGASLVAEANVIRAAGRRGGEVDPVVHRQRQIRARLLQERRFAAAASVHQQMAATLSEAGRVSEAMAEYDQAVASAKEWRIQPVLAETCFWRAKARCQHRLPDAEADFIAALDYYRGSGVKPREARVFHRYAELLLDQGRLAEALRVMEECLRSVRSMKAIWLEPEYGATQAAILLALGQRRQAEALWNRVLSQLDRFRFRSELNDTQLGVILGWRIRFLQDTGQWVELARLRERIQAWREESLLEAETAEAAFARIARQIQAAETNPAPASSFPAATVPASTPRNPVELQPAQLASRSVGTARARAWFWLVNACEQPREGSLNVFGLPAKATWRETPEGWLCIEDSTRDEADGGSLPIPVQFPPWGSRAIQLAASPPTLGEERQVTLVWTGNATVTKSVWTLGGADAADGPTATVRTSLSFDNGFHALPVYHEIGWDGLPETSLVNFRVRTTRPCRVEIYEQRSEELLAVDAQGDGSFLTQGDLLGRDRDGDGHPEASAGALPIIAYVFPIGGPTQPGPLKIAFEVRDGETWIPWGADWMLEFNVRRD